MTNLKGVPTMPTRWVINWLARRAAPAVLLALVTAGCAAGGSEGPAGSAAPSSVSPIPVNSNPRPSQASETGTADVTVEVTIADGKVTPNGTGVRVDRGQSVQVSAVSDVEESLHIHGYDKTITLPAGQPSAVTFLADQSGVFEIETHASGKLVAKLIVS